ncbi:ER membrane protein complex subunit 1 [Euwallacea similis]|uniref:ER membrane protein complex subunit 1 n=1 Tax=Euwallacea similis TaxID=1736056 RepID=UPI00344FFAD4
MANFRSIYKVQVFLTILIHLTLALYEDQVGKFDWKRSFVGKVKFVSWEARRIIVATEENVLASLDLKTGDIQWRQLLEEPSDSQIQLLLVGKEILTVSGSGNNWLVRTWELNTGGLLNEWPLNAERIIPSAFSIADGKLFHLVPIAGSHLEFTVYSLSQSDKVKPSVRKVSAPWLTGTSDCVTANSHFVCLKSNQIYFIDLLQENSEFVSKPVETVIGTAAYNVVLIQLNQEEAAVLVRYSNEAKLLVLKGNDIITKSFNVMPNAVTVSEEGRKVIYQLEANDNNKNKLIRVNSKEYERGRDLLGVDLDYPVGLGAPIILGGFTRGSVTDLLLSTTDHALLLVRLPEGKILWTREEALSSILATEFIELPVSELDASIEHEFDESGGLISMFTHRISTQVNQLYNLLFGNQLLSSNGMVRDEFGLHKIIVVATRAGKLFAIDTLSGSIAWSYRLPNVQPFIRINGEEKVVLLVQRTAQYAPLPAQCILLAQDAITGQGILFQFDPISGHSSEGIQRLSYKIFQAVLLPHQNKNFLKPVLVLSDQNEPHLYPIESFSTIKSYLSTTFLYTVDPITSTLTGFSLRYSEENSLRVVPIWDVKLSPSKIVEVSAKHPNERVHSQGKVLYDRSVYYKYVNPNLLAVATVNPDQIHRTVVSIYLIDGVTGLVLYSVSHKRAKGPIYLVHSENWLVYSYFNERFRRMEVSAIELYEGHLQTNSTVFSSFAVHQLPDIQSQSYILPAVPVKMAVTLTERGITNKFLLIALSNGAVVEIPWLLLQPRFPGMPCGLEESCIPYIPEIPLHSEAIINYNQTLSRIRGIEIAPARLESTSHILVHGLDIFYTRVAPSKTFDLLKDDFDHRLIVLVLSLLIAASFITKHLAARKMLKQAWK